MAATNSNIVSFGSHKNQMQKKQSPFQKEIKTCRAILSSSLPDCFGFLNNLDDSLFKLADRAENNQQQEDYFAVMRQFRIKQDSIKKQFTQLVLTDFDSFWSLESTTESSENDLSLDAELSIMQNDDLEEEIAMKRIATKGDSLLGNSLTHLDSRFAHMLSIDGSIDNPLATLKIASHLQQVISPLTSDIAIRLVTYKQFEQHAIAELAKLFQKLNETLAEHDVLSDLGQSKGKRKASNNKASNKPQSETLLSESFYDDEQEESAVFDELRQLLGNIRSTQQPSQQDTRQQNRASGSTADISALISALSGLQQSSSQLSYNESGAVELPDLRQSLLNNLGQTQADGSVVSPSMSSIDDDTLNVITFLFEFILEDSSIPAPIRALLARLQFPMLKVALTDKTFFSKKTHTARVLLNSLAKVSTGWDHSNGTEDILFNQVESIVNSILTNFDSDLQIFTDLTDQLDQFVKQQEQSSYFAEQRISKATEGQEKLIAAQQEVDFVINQHLTQYSPVPKAVITLIEDSWRQVLRLRYLQKGKDSPEWENAVALMERLLWSVTPKAEAIERKKLLETIPKLLKSLREILSGASFNQHKITALFKDLQECHIKCLNGNAIEKEELQTVDKQEGLLELTSDIETISHIEEEKKVLSDEEALNAAKQLEVGTWIEVTQNEKDEVQRIKFSWRSNLTGRCLFVTYQGLKAAELALSELAGWFQQGQAIILDQAATPLMDRALVSMKDTIEQNGSDNTELTT